jgi:hypothetical protein
LKCWRFIFADQNPAELLLGDFLQVILEGWVCGPTSFITDLEMTEELYRNILIAWSRVMRVRYPTAKFAYYVHIVIAHSADLIYTLGSLAKYSNEAVENLHCLINQQLLSFQVKYVAIVACR